MDMIITPMCHVLQATAYSRCLRRHHAVPIFLKALGSTDYFVSVKVIAIKIDLTIMCLPIVSRMLLGNGLIAFYQKTYLKLGSGSVVE